MRRIATTATLVLMISSALAAQTSDALRAAVRQYGNRALPVPAQSKALTATNSKIDPALQDLTSGVSKGVGVQTTDVTLVAANAAAIPSLTAAVTRRGGRVTGQFEDTVFARVPITAIQALGNAPGLFRMNLQPVAHPDQTTLDKGVDLETGLGVKALHEAGIRGRGVRVGIIDMGFAHYDDYISSGKVPGPAAARAFSASNRLDGGGEVHGTGCAEIIHAMAPDAELVLATFDGTEAELFNAIQWMVTQKVQIISFSAGFLAGPRNGQSQIDRMVDSVVRKNHILWVNSSGNSATAHWMGDASRHDAGGWVQFSSERKEKLFLRSTDTKISIDVMWDDWGSDTQRPVAREGIDAYLFSADNGQFHELASRQFDNRGSSPPMENFSATVEKNKIYVLALKAGSVRRPLRLHVFTTNLEQADFVPEGSVLIPATANASLTVGAINLRTQDLEDFSSRGPTDDGRPKPDLSAYDRMQVAVFPLGFAGTSAACPHAAGFAALAAQARPGTYGEDLRQTMLRLIRPPRPGSPAGSTGAGIIDPDRLLQAPAPVSSGQRLTLPSAFGDSISIPALERLRSRQTEFRRFNTRVALGRDGAYRDGDGLKLAWRTDADAYYVVLYRDSQGAWSVILPSAKRDTATLSAGRGYVFPELEGDHITVRPPFGPQDLILICAKRPLRLEEMLQSDPEGLRNLVSIASATYQVIK